MNRDLIEKKPPRSSNRHQLRRTRAILFAYQSSKLLVDNEKQQIGKAMVQILDGFHMDSHRFGTDFTERDDLVSTTALFT